MKKEDVIEFIIDHLSLNEGAYIYRKLKPLTKTAVRELRRQSAPKDKTYSVYDILQFEDFIVEQNVHCKRTMFVYVYNAAPSYLNLSTQDACPSALIERRSSYLLLLEYPRYVVIFKKNIGSLKPIREFIDVVSTYSLANALINASTQFKKLATTSMGMSENSITNRSFGGNQLSFALPMSGQNRNIVNEVTFTVGNDSYGISLNTSRLAKLGSKKSLDELTKWVYSILGTIDNYNNTNRTFLNNFAFPISWREEYENLEPSTILFNAFSLYDYITSKGDGCVYLRYKGNYRKLIGQLFNKIWSLSSSVDLKFNENESDKNLKLYNIVYPDTTTKHFDDKLFVTSEKSKIVVSSKGRAAQLYTQVAGNYVRLLTIIRNQNYFQVGFEDCGFIYANGRLYQDANVGESMDIVLSVLQPEEKIADSQYEKFFKNKIVGTETDFGEYSLFHYVETEFFKDCDYIICDDLGDEWADHICIKNNSIFFVHSKWKGGTSLSASNFQDVIGQALKNIGNMQHNGNKIRDKRSKFISTYADDKTTINRARNIPEGKNIDQYVDEFIDKFEKIIKNPNGIREVCLVVSFLSEKEFRDAMEKIRRGEDFAKRKTTIQLFWLLSSFISECKSNDMHCRIICHK